MNRAQEYKTPLAIGAGALVVAILLYALVVAPQSSKLSNLKTQEATLQTQETTLQTQLTSLESEKQKLSANCTNLEKISTQIPSVQNPGDLAAEQSSFYNQLTALVGQSGTSIPTFSWTGSTAPGSTGVTTPATGAKPATSNVVPVPVSMVITGDYAQMSSFVAGLDSFPRLFAIQTFTLAFGASATASASGSSASGATTASESAPNLWVGGQATAGSAGPYALTLTGSIYYTTAPIPITACNAAAKTTTAAKAVPATAGSPHITTPKGGSGAT